jgi:hypothetical protein
MHFIGLFGPRLLVRIEWTPQEIRDAGMLIPVADVTHKQAALQIGN